MGNLAKGSPLIKKINFFFVSYLTRADVHSEVKRFNENVHKVEVSYAYGYAFSEDYSECTMKTLFDKADKHMYENKAIEKAKLKVTAQ
ncbi:hypothetical protein DXA60_15385 [Roseburia sp. OF03-24]|uniref:hypothetical protein n=1 Tax=Roseburia sp. OF03-24 TaxID=2292367 RepID=UPI000E4E9B73|nr:hypothetical protein [Roseburia sp. OF03-24]RGX90849.1 hypothetical protein DXA60_15385 [Roseburia sp. OF03-24]